MFDQAIQMGLPAIQTQHPGLYFEQAATHGRRRRQAADALPLVSGGVEDGTGHRRRGEGDTLALVSGGVEDGTEEEGRYPASGQWRGGGRDTEGGGAIPCL